MHDTVSTVRDPESTQAWLVGSGIASLAAAVHLIRDARVPGGNIHILDRHAQTGGE
jgi:oleate hydratase